MANKKVILIRLCKTPSGWKRLPAVIGKNGKIRPGYALLDGEPVSYPTGHYELRTYEGKRTVYRNVGEDAADALAAQQRESHLLLARESAKAAGVQIVTQDRSRASLLRKKDEFIQRHLAKGQKRAAETSKIAIEGFLEATGHVYSDQVTESSVLMFYKHLRKAGNQDRTIYNKHMSLFGWFKWLGLDTKKLAESAPAYTEREVEVFHAQDLGKLFGACHPQQRLVFETLLKTGLRMKEAMHLEWTNVDFRKKVIRVREYLDDDSNPDVRIKDRAERSVPLPDDLAERLSEHRAQNPNTVLVLGTKHDTPNWKWLQMLKRAVRKAGLNCAHCAGCRASGECSRWKIHKFRATYTTNMLRSGFDVRTVMSYTGHADMATVMRYLAPAEDADTRSRINTVKWTT